MRSWQSHDRCLEPFLSVVLSLLVVSNVFSFYLCVGSSYMNEFHNPREKAQFGFVDHSHVVHVQDYICKVTDKQTSRQE